MSTTSSADSATSTPAATSAAAPVILNPYSTVVVRSHVPVLLDMQQSNYTKWSSFFTTMCGKFGLLSHIDGTAADPTNDLWSQADYAVKSWI